MSKRYSVSRVRERLSDALDEADRGVAVFIERRGIRYQLSLAPKKARRPAAKRTPRIEVLDPAIEDGSWNWAWSPGRMTFRPRRAK
jgi:hypothetical protein